MVTFPKNSMKTPSSILSLLLLGGIAWHGGPALRDLQAEPARPNIILIMSDDMGWSDIGCYGGEIPTPTLDRLAENGLRYTQFYNTGRCCPTRASLLTGLYPHQAGIGHMMGNDNLPGYQGNLNAQCRTIAEVLHPAGYGTYLAGKWHVASATSPDGPKFNWPLQRGFDRFYGTIHGAGSFYDPNTLTRDNTFISPYADSEYQPEGPYYYTDAISDHAVRFIEEHEAARPEDPFFVYVSYTAAHWPMHALEEDIELFRGKYDNGYAPTQQARLDKLKDLGLIDPSWTPAPLVGDWEKEPLKEWQARCMEVYAAMVYSMDRGIGRIVSALEAGGELDNTLIFFLQDNGGCAETYGRRSDGKPRAEGPTLPPLADDYLQPDMRPKQTRDGYPLREGRGVMPGPPDTDIGYGEEWANVSNTPFRLYKHYVHEGGIATPLIAHWPKGIGEARRNQLESQPAHLIDIMATAVDLAGADYPETIESESIHPLEGVSLAPSFTGKDLGRETPLYWEHEGNRAIRDGDWKLVARGSKGPWELYDMKADRTETRNLVGEKPDLAARLAEDWETWALRALVKPWKWDRQKKNSQAGIAKDKTKFSGQAGAVLSKGSPDIGGKAFTVSAKLQSAGTGVIISQGGVTHGWALYFDPDSGVASVALRRSGKLETISGKPTDLPDGETTLSMDLAKDGHLEVAIGDAIVIDQATGGPLTQTPQDPLSIGHDSNDPAGAYPRGSKFTGALGKVTLTLDP